MKPRRCPRCRAKVEYFIEIWNGHTIEFDAGPDGFPLRDKHGSREPGILRERGGPVKVDGICLNGHRWRLRVVTSVPEIQP